MYDTCFVCGKKTSQQLSDPKVWHVCSLNCYQQKNYLTYPKSARSIQSNFPNEKPELKIGIVQDWFGIASTEDTWRIIQDRRSRFDRALMAGTTPGLFGPDIRNDAQLFWTFLLEKSIERVQVTSKSIPPKGLVFVLTTEGDNSKVAIWKQKNAATKVKFYLRYNERVSRLFNIAKSREDLNWERFPFEHYWSAATHRNSFDRNQPQSIHRKLGSLAGSSIRLAVETLLNNQRNDNSIWQISFTQVGDDQWEFKQLRLTENFKPYGGTEIFLPNIINEDRFAVSQWIEASFTFLSEWVEKSTALLIKDNLLSAFDQPRTLRIPYFNPYAPALLHKMMAMDLFFGDIEIQGAGLKQVQRRRRLASDFNPVCLTKFSGPFLSKQLFSVMLHPFWGREEDFRSLPSIFAGEYDRFWALEYFFQSKLRLNYDDEGEEEYSRDFLKPAVGELFNWVENYEFSDDLSKTHDILLSFSSTVEEPSNFTTEFKWIERSQITEVSSVELTAAPVPVLQPMEPSQKPAIVKIEKDSETSESDNDELMDLMEQEQQKPTAPIPGVKIEPLPELIRIDSSDSDSPENEPEEFQEQQGTYNAPNIFNIVEAVTTDPKAPFASIYDWFGIATSLPKRVSAEFSNKLWNVTLQRSFVEEGDPNTADTLLEERDYFVVNRRWIWCALLVEFIRSIKIRCPTLGQSFAHKISNASTPKYVTWESAPTDSAPTVEITAAITQDFSEIFRLLKSDPDFAWKRFQFGIFWSCMTCDDAFDWRNPNYIHGKLYSLAETALPTLFDAILSKTKQNPNQTYRIKYAFVGDTWKRGKMMQVTASSEEPAVRVENSSDVLGVKEIDIQQWLRMQTVPLQEWQRKSALGYTKDSLMRNFTDPQQSATPFFNKDLSNPTLPQKAMMIDLIFSNITCKTSAMGEPRTLVGRVASRSSPKFVLTVEENENPQSATVEFEINPLHPGIRKFALSFVGLLNEPDFLRLYLPQSRLGLEDLSDLMGGPFLRALERLMRYLVELNWQDRWEERDGNTDDSRPHTLVYQVDFLDQTDVKEDEDEEYDPDNENVEVYSWFKLREKEVKYPVPAEIKQASASEIPGDAKPVRKPTQKPTTSVPVNPAAGPPGSTPKPAEKKKDKKKKKKDKKKSKKDKKKSKKEKSKKDKKAIPVQPATVRPTTVPMVVVPTPMPTPAPVPEPVLPTQPAATSVPSIEPIVVGGPPLERTIKTAAQYRGPNAGVLKARMISDLAKEKLDEWIEGWKHESLAVVMLLLDSLMDIGVRVKQLNGSTIYKVIPIEASEIHWPTNTKPAEPLTVGIRFNGTETDERKNMWFILKKLSNMQPFSDMFRSQNKESDAFRQTYWKSRFRLPNRGWKDLLKLEKPADAKSTSQLAAMAIAELLYQSRYVPADGSSIFFTLGKEKQWTEKRTKNGPFFVGEVLTATVESKRKNPDDSGNKSKRRKEEPGSVDDAMQYFDNPEVAMEIEQKFQSMPAEQWVGSVNQTQASCFLLDKLVRSFSILVEPGEASKRYFQQVPQKGSREIWDNKASIVTPLVVRLEISGSETANRTRVWAACQAAIQESFVLLRKRPSLPVFKVYMERRFSVPDRGFEWELPVAETDTLYQALGADLKSISKNPPVQTRAVFYRFYKTWVRTYANSAYPVFVNSNHGQVQKAFVETRPDFKQSNPWVFAKSNKEFDMLVKVDSAKLDELEALPDSILETPIRQVYRSVYLAIRSLTSTTYRAEYDWLEVKVNLRYYEQIENALTVDDFSFAQIVAVKLARQKQFPDADYLAATNLIWRLLRSRTVKELFPKDDELRFVLMRSNTRRITVAINALTMSLRDLEDIINTLPRYTERSLVHSMTYPKFARILTFKSAPYISLDLSKPSDIRTLIYLKKYNRDAAEIVLLTSLIRDVTRFASDVSDNDLYEKKYDQYSTKVVKAENNSIEIVVRSEWIKFAHGLRESPSVPLMRFIWQNRVDEDQAFSFLHKGAAVLETLWKEVFLGTSRLPRLETPEIKLTISESGDFYIGKSTTPVNLIQLLTHSNTLSVENTLDTPVIHVGGEKTANTELDHIRIENTVGVLLIEHRQMLYTPVFPRVPADKRLSLEKLRRLTSALIVATELWDTSCGNLVVRNQTEALAVKGYRAPRKHTGWDLQARFILSGNPDISEKLDQRLSSGRIDLNDVAEAIPSTKELKLFTNKEAAYLFLLRLSEPLATAIVFIYSQETERWAIVDKSSPLAQLW